MNECLPSICAVAYRTCRIGFSSVLLTLAASGVCWAQSNFRRVPAESLAESTDYRFWIKVGGMVLVVVITYALAFKVVFTSLLRRGTGPLTSYGVSWAVLFVGCTVFAIVLFYKDLLPGKWTNMTPFVKKHLWHIGVAAAGAMMAFMSLLLYRSGGQRRGLEEQPEPEEAST